jgi:hypothetical protein
MKRGHNKRDDKKRDNLWQLALTAVVAALLVHNAITGGPAKARGYVPPSAFTQTR